MYFYIIGQYNSFSYDDVLMIWTHVQIAATLDFVFRAAENMSKSLFYRKLTKGPSY